jgi:hypothetical protein
MVEAIDELSSASETEPIPPVRHAVAAAGDRVVLSDAAQVSLLSQQGLSLTEIADELDMTLNVVMKDLGITDTGGARI